ncbi:YcbK family protein [Hoeflea sp.]|uniref:YcbK family protein n=1 Tax=Hoeflea sp. TaxID=1940281 RepID=UPI003B026963
MAYALSGCVSVLTEPVFGPADRAETSDPPLAPFAGNAAVAETTITTVGENMPQDGSLIRLPAEHIPRKTVTPASDTGSPAGSAHDPFRDWSALGAQGDSSDDPLQMVHAFAAPARKTGNLSRLYSSGRSQTLKPIINMDRSGRTGLRHGAIGNAPQFRMHASISDAAHADAQPGSPIGSKAATVDRTRQVHLASAAGLARLAPNGLRVQHGGVQTACLKPGLLQILDDVRHHFGRDVVITSGYRSAEHQRRIGGVSGSKHITCEAADIQVPGIDKWELATYLRGLPGRGGVGTYCHTKSVHIDIGSKRDWNWGCKRR